MTAKVKLTSWFKLNTKKFYLTIICLIFAWLTLIICINKWNSGSRKSNKYSRILYSKRSDSHFCNDPIKSHRQFDVVLSYYSEDIDFVAQYIRDLRNISTIKMLNPRIIVYNKNSQINNEVLKLLLRADVVQVLPNFGREGGTFLYHIINNYDLIANHTIFSQAGVEGITKQGLADWYSDRLENQFNTSVGFMPLVSNNLILNYDCGTHRTGNFPRIAQLWSMLETKSMSTRWTSGLLKTLNDNDICIYIFRLFSEVNFW